MKEPTKSEVQRKADKMETEKNDKIRKGEYQVSFAPPTLMENPRLISTRELNW